MRSLSFLCFLLLTPRPKRRSDKKGFSKLLSQWSLLKTEVYFCVLVDRKKLGPRKHWHTHHWNLGEKPGSKKVSPDRCFPWAALDRRNWRCKHSVTLFQRYYRDTSTWNPLESSYFKATEPFNVSYVDLSEYSISVQYYLAISFPKSIRSWSRGT